MYRLYRIYTGIKNKYVEGIGWVKANADTKGNKTEMYEMSYIELDSDGVVHYTGTEDFSAMRFKSLQRKFVKVRKGYEKEKPTLKTKYGWDVVDEKTVYVRENKDIKAYYRLLTTMYREYDMLKVGV